MIGQQFIGTKSELDAALVKIEQDEKNHQDYLEEFLSNIKRLEIDGGTDITGFVEIEDFSGNVIKYKIDEEDIVFVDEDIIGMVDYDDMSVEWL